MLEQLVFDYIENIEGIRITALNYIEELRVPHPNDPNRIIEQYHLYTAQVMGDTKYYIAHATESSAGAFAATPEVLLQYFPDHAPKPIQPLPPIA